MDNPEVIIIGQGPAGLSAAIYTARAGMRTLVLGGDPKVAGDYDIDNYFGFPETIKGQELIQRGAAQAERFGAVIRRERIVAAHHHEKGGFGIKTEAGEHHACALILATGISRVRPGIKNLAEYEGKGVSYCVSCDGFFFKGKPVVVVGEGNFAANQAVELYNYTQSVTVVTQGKAMAMGEAFLSKLSELSIPVLEKRIDRLEGDSGLDRVVLEDGASLEAQGLFVAIGEASSSDFAYSLGLLREGAFIKCDEEQRTNIDGVFAAGDCVGGFLQISKAVGEGAKAGRAAIDFIKRSCRAAS